MVPIIKVISLIIISVLNLTGIVTSGFIVALNLLDWAHGRTLNSLDLILISMGLSNASFQCTVIVQTYISKLWLEVHDMDSNCLVLFQLHMWTGSFSVWLNTCLCVFYCIKIVDFNHGLFVWLKLRISKVVHLLLLGSMLGSLALSVPIHWYPDSVFNHTSTTIRMSTCTISGAALTLQAPYPIVLAFLGFCLPLLLGVFFITPILASLYRHTQRMKDSASGVSEPRLEAHISAARILGSLLMINIIILVTMAIKDLSSSDLLRLALWIIIVSCVTAQSVTLILGNTRLKTALWKVFSTWRK
ncbi:taste receptor type 2 member 9-like [Pleurodeles waltl]|uniref:taste receptor type 2 member 9-like n=1 Tax=Pleurodeles waltl TaxID=8319 RepID=UPI0037093DDB